MSAESTPSDPYEVVLLDLRAKKEQIEQAISAIEAIRGNGPSTSSGRSPSVSNSQASASLDSPGAFLGMNIVDAAKKLLAAKREPLRNPDIATAFQRGGLVLNSKEPANTIGSVLSRRQAEVGDVVKVGRGTWGLKEWYPNRSFKKAGGESRESTKADTDLGLLEPEPTASSGTAASVPFMITQAMRDKLRENGASDDDIRNMTPAEAQSYINDLEFP